MSHPSTRLPSAEEAGAAELLEQVQRNVWGYNKNPAQCDPGSGVANWCEVIQVGYWQACGLADATGVYLVVVIAFKLIRILVLVR